MYFLSPQYSMKICIVCLLSTNFKSFCPRVLELLEIIPENLLKFQQIRGKTFSLDAHINLRQINRYANGKIS